MKALELNRYIFAWLCICPIPDKNNRLMKHFRVLVASGMMIIECLAGIASCLFIYTFLSTDFENCLYATFQVAALFSVIYMWTIAYILRDRVNIMFSKFQIIYDLNEDTSLMPYLNEARRKIVWITKVLVIYLSCSFVLILTIAGILNVYHCLMVYGFIDGNRLYFPYHFVLPWNQQTLFGWIALNIFSALAAPFYLIIDYSFLAFFIGICEHHQAFYRFFGASLDQFDAIPVSNSFEIRFQLIRLIQFHNSTRHLFLETANFFSVFILTQLICSVIYLACSIFLSDTIVQHFDLSIGVLFFCVFVSGSNLFLYCYFGGRSTLITISYGDLLYQSEWFRLPTELERYVTVMIANSQRPLHYHGFQLARLNLQTFCGLLRNVISYYMAFKTLTTK